MNPKPPPFTRHGTAENRIEVSADEILEAIAEGRDVDIKYGVIEGNLDIGKIDDRLENDENGIPLIRGEVKIESSEIICDMSFSSVKFIGDAKFNGTSFNCYADFYSVEFLRAHFNSASFIDIAYFDSASFKIYTSFRSAIFHGNRRLTVSD